VIIVELHMVIVVELHFGENCRTIHVYVYI